VVFRRTGRAALLAGAVVLGGCFDFEAAIDPTPKHALDPALAGTWRCLPVDAKPDTQPANFVVARARDFVYSIRFEEQGQKPDVYEAHVSEVKGHNLLNVRDLHTTFPNKPWSFARYTFLLPDVLRVQLVDDEALEGVEQTPASLRAALERLDGQPGLYADFCVCVRAATASQ
jgi:hypothetical protein